MSKSTLDLWFVIALGFTPEAAKGMMERATLPMPLHLDGAVVGTVTRLEARGGEVHALVTVTDVDAVAKLHQTMAPSFALSAS